MDGVLEFEAGCRSLISPFEAQYDQPRYKQLYVYNRIEAEQSKAMFSALFWQAVKDKGGRKNQGGEQYTKDEIKTHKQYMSNMEAQQFLKECEQLVDEKFATSAEVQESQDRCNKNEANTLSGFDPSLFLGHAEAAFKTFVCILGHRVLCNPVNSNACDGHLFCKGCIDGHLVCGNATCPSIEHGSSPQVINH